MRALVLVRGMFGGLTTPLTCERRGPPVPRDSRRTALLPAAVALVLGVATAAAVIGADSGRDARAAAAWPAHVFAPYVDTGLSNTTLTTVAADYGTQYFMLAFVNGSGCQWSLPNQSGWQSQISALQAEGGDVSISFGGYTVDTDDTDLGAQCSSASAMAAQVESVVTMLNVTRLDFDIESNEQYNNADLALTAQALMLPMSMNGMSLPFPVPGSYLSASTRSLVVYSTGTNDTCLLRHDEP
jgi:hypothetical protein